MQKTSRMLFGFIALTLVAICAHPQRRIITPPEVKRPSIDRIKTSPTGDPIYQPLRVPPILGMFVEDAKNKLAQFGLKWKETYLTQPEPSLRRGHVSAVIPEVGSAVQRA